MKPLRALCPLKRCLPLAITQVTKLKSSHTRALRRKTKKQASKGAVEAPAGGASAAEMLEEEDFEEEHAHVVGNEDDDDPHHHHLHGRAHEEYIERLAGAHSASQTHVHGIQAERRLYEERHGSLGREAWA